MPRPRRIRRIFFQPDVTYFKPAGVRLARLLESVLTFPELESIRLIDLEEIQQAKAAKKMKISQPTLSRLLKSARKKLADAVIYGKSIRIQGGAFQMVRRRGLGLRRAGRPVGRMGGAAAGPGGYCICPKCGHKEKHTTAIPCYQKRCPKCKTKMRRA